MALFNHYLPHLYANEGYYANNTKDLGKETYVGISRVYHPSWAGWELIDRYKAVAKLNLTNRTGWNQLSKILRADTKLTNLVLSFYAAQYWSNIGLDAVESQSVAEIICDHAINAGVSRVGWMVQHVLVHTFKANIVLDGAIGAKTVAALNDVDAATFHAAFKQMRVDFYQYRAGTYKNEPRLVSLHQFFSSRLKLKTNKDQAVFLNSWLSRVNAMKFTS